MEWEVNRRGSVERSIMSLYDLIAVISATNQPTDQLLFPGQSSSSRNKRTYESTKVGRWTSRFRGLQTRKSVDDDDDDDVKPNYD